MDVKRMRRREMGVCKRKELQNWSTRQMLSLKLRRVYKYRREKGGETSKVFTLCLEQQEQRYLLAGHFKGKVGIYDLHAPSTSTDSLQNPDVCLAAESDGGHSSMLSAVDWYPNDTGLFASSSRDGRCVLWDTNRLAPIDTYSLQQPIASQHWSSGGRACLIAVSTGRHSRCAQLIDIKSGSAVRQLRDGHQTGVSAVRWVGHSELLATGGQDGLICLWDIRNSRKALASMPLKKNEGASVISLRVSRDGGRLYAVSAAGHYSPTAWLSTWNLFSGREIVRERCQLHFVAARSYNRLPFAVCTNGERTADCLFVPSGHDIRLLQPTVAPGVQRSVGCLQGHLQTVLDCVYRTEHQDLWSCGLDQLLVQWAPAQQCPEDESAAGAPDERWSDEETTTVAQ